VKDWVTERRLADCVHFVKHLSGVDVIQAYVDADVFVLPSYTENFGMTVVEAMACGVPVVISDQVNIFREVAHYGAGIVTRCDIHELERALKDLLSDPFLRKLMGQAGRIAARQHYGWLPVVNELTKEYNAVIARSRNMVTLHEPV
jgi:glycosyltransferase involved in cell wall biosynthesis